MLVPQKAMPSYQHNSRVAESIQFGDTVELKRLLSSMSSEERLMELSGVNNRKQKLIHDVILRKQTVKKNSGETKTSIVATLIEVLSVSELLHLLRIADEDGNTAVHLEAIRGQADFIGYVSNATKPTELYSLLGLQNADGDTALHCAADSGHVDILKHSRDHLEPDYFCEIISQVNEGGYTVLHNAVVEGHMEVVEYIIGNIQTPKNLYNLLRVQNNTGRTVIHDAASQGKTVMLKYMVGAAMEPADLRTLLLLVNDSGSTALHFAAIRGHADIVECLLSFIPKTFRFELLKLQDSTDGHTRDGYTALHGAANRGRADIVKYILASIPENFKFELLKLKDSSDGYTALHGAANRGCADIFNYIADAIPADDFFKLLQIQNVVGDTAVHCAAQQGHTKVLESIFDSVRDTDRLKLLSMENDNRYTALHSAAAVSTLKMMSEGERKRQEQAMRLLLDSMKEVDSVDKLLKVKSKDGLTVIHYAACESTAILLRCVIDFIAPSEMHMSLSIPDKYGSTALHYAVRYSQIETLRCIITSMLARSNKQSSSSIYELMKIQDKLGNTALHYAVASGWIDGIGCLLDDLSRQQRLALLKTPNHQSQTPENVSVRMNRSNVISSLEKYQGLNQRQENRQDHLANEVLEIEHLRVEERNLISEKDRIVAKLEVVQKRIRECYQIYTHGREDQSELQKLKDAYFTGKRDATTNTDAMITGVPIEEISPYATSDDGSVDSEEEAYQQFQRKMSARKTASPRERAAGLGTESGRKPIPAELFHLINRLCREMGVMSAITTQSTKNWREVLVLGVNASIIKEKLLKEVEEDPRFSDFEFLIHDSDNPIRRKALSLTVYKKRIMNQEDQWGEVRSTTSELLVRTEEDRGKYRHNRCRHGAIYALVPAHFVLTKAQTTGATAALRRYTPNILEDREAGDIDCEHHATSESELMARDVDSEDELEITQARQGFEARISKRRFSASVTGDGVNNRADLNNPILISYRQKILARHNGVIQCPIQRCNFDQGDTCHHMFMNDIALLPLEYGDAVRLQRTLQLSPYPVLENVIQVNSVDHLLWLHQEERIVRVREKTGHLRVFDWSDENGQQMASHVSFILTSDSSTPGEPDTLEDGDCGSIVQMKSLNSDDWKPLGMFVSMLQINTKKDGFMENIYQAVLLCQAFTDLEKEYPHRIGPLTRFRLQQRHLNLP